MKMKNKKKQNKSRQITRTRCVHVKNCRSSFGYLNRYIIFNIETWSNGQFDWATLFEAMMCVVTGFFPNYRIQTHTCITCLIQVLFFVFPLAFKKNTTISISILALHSTLNMNKHAMVLVDVCSSHCFYVFRLKWYTQNKSKMQTANSNRSEHLKKKTKQKSY